MYIYRSFLFDYFHPFSETGPNFFLYWDFLYLLFFNTTMGGGSSGHSKLLEDFKNLSPYALTHLARSHIFKLDLR